MDKTDTHNEITEDMTRESLIAISYVLPESDPADEITLPKHIDCEKTTQPLNSNREEKYRSELISISYLPPPESQGLPQQMLPGGELAG